MPTFCRISLLICSISLYSLHVMGQNKYNDLVLTQLPACIKEVDATQKVDITFTASTPETVTVGDKFQLIFTVVFPDTLSNADDIKNLSLPKLQGIEVLMGPIVSSITKRIQGKSIIMREIRYIYILSALQEDDFIIPGMTITANGQQLHSQPIIIKVLPARQSLPEEKVSVELNTFVTMKVSERSPRINSPIVLECKLYTTALIDYIGNIEQLISSDDFKIKSVDMKDSQWELGYLNGKKYKIITFRKLLLYPSYIGELRIGNLNMDVYSKVNIPVNTRLENENNTVKTRISCQGITIHSHK